MHFELAREDIDNLQFPRALGRRRGQLQFDAAGKHYRLNFNVRDSSGLFAYERSRQIWREAYTTKDIYRATVH